MKALAAVVAVAAVLLVLLLMRQGGPAEPAVVEVLHQDSIPSDGGYDETFLVRGELDPAEAVVYVDDAPVEVAWSDADCLEFTVWMEERDGLVPMRLEVGGEVVWEGTYGAGSGTPVHDC